MSFYPGQTSLLSRIRYPGQENAAGSSKIPSVMYYDKELRMRFAGAEADLLDNLEVVEDEGLIRVEW